MRSDPEVAAKVAELVAQMVPQARAEAYKTWQRAPHALELDELHAIALKGLAEASARWETYCFEKGHDPHAYEYFPAYCVVPSVRVLTSDLRWIPIGELEAGGELVGVEEEAAGRGRYRRFVRSTVLETSRRDALCLKLTLTDGREITCSADHRWLVWGRGHKQSGAYNWRESTRLTPGTRISAQLLPWEEETSFEAGWLAGIIDGEGNYRGHLKREYSRDGTGHYYGIQITQNKGPVLDRALGVLDSMGVPYRLLDKAKSDVCVRVDIDQLWAVLKLVGGLKLSRLDGRLLWEGRCAVNRLGMNYVEVAEIEPAGVQEVVTIETSSGTYLAEGLVAHNCLARMRGAMLDWLRAQDWVTRSDRMRAKQIRDAGQDRGATDAELAAATGMSLSEVRSTVAAVAARPVSLDAEPHDVADESDVESQAVVGQVLAAATAVTAGLPPQAQVLLAMRYYADRSLAEVAQILGLDPAEAGRLHTSAVLAVHDAMLKMVA